MATFQSHLSVLESSVKLYPTRPAFRFPIVGQETSQISEWATVTYAQFHKDVEIYARYWISVLSTAGITPGSVVGLWVGGIAYSDVLQVYGMSRAGYIPQMSSLRVSTPIVIFELLKKAGARAFIYEPSSGLDLSGCPVPAYPAILVSGQDVTEIVLPPLRMDHSASDLVFILHTSGSTGGSPKLVPCNHRWVDNVITKVRQTSQVCSVKGQDVVVAIGNICHLAQTTRLIGSLCHGSCTIQPTTIAFSSEELLDMIARCGLNRLNQIATFLGHHLRNSKTSPELLKALVQLEEVFYTGAELGCEEQAWAVKNGIKLRNAYGCTEAGVLMVSAGRHGPYASLLVPLEGTSYTFLPVEFDDEPSTSSGAPQGSTNHLLELVVLSDSDNCPDISLRHADGHFHTGDLFLEAGPGKYLFRGRNNDWIKTGGGKCDSKSIEDGVRATCGELIFDCVVVGNGRIRPTLFVEASEKCPMDVEKLKEEVVERMKQFNHRHYAQERITSTKHVVVVEHGTLPRTPTKGNIRRRAVEDEYKELLDGICATY